MSGYGNPILQTGNPIGDALPLLLRALDDRPSRAFQQRSLDRQDQQFAYRQAQDARKWDQGQTDAGAMSTALVGGLPSLQGVSPNGISKIAEIQNRAELARSAKLDKTLQFLEPHVLNGSKMAQHNYDRAMSEYFGEDFTGSGEALRTGQFDKFIQQKQLEKQIALETKMAEQEMMRQINAPENLARVKLAGMPTVGLDGTMGPPDQMAEALYNADPADARGWMDDQRAEKASAAKAAEKAKPYTPTPQDIADARANLPSLKTKPDEEVAGFLRMRKGGFINQEDANISGTKRDPNAKELAKLDLDEAQDELATLIKELDAAGFDGKKKATLEAQIKETKARVKTARAEYRKYLQGATAGGGAGAPAPASADPMAMARQWKATNPMQQGETEDQYLDRMMAALGIQE